MKTLTEIKNNYAKEQGYLSWESLLSTLSFDIDFICKHENKVFELVQIEQQKLIAENIKDITSIETIIKYYEEINYDYISKKDVISLLYALKQFEQSGLNIVGMGYKRYDGKEITDMKGMFEGGYFTETKSSIINENNIIK